MENMHSFWQLGDELRGQARGLEDQRWLMVASSLGEQTRLKGERFNNLDLSKASADTMSRDKFRFQDNKFENLNFDMLNLGSKLTANVSKTSFGSGMYNAIAVHQKNNDNFVGNWTTNKYSGDIQSKEPKGNSNRNKESNENNAAEKRFKTLPATEILPRDEVLGGYIFVCNNDTMQEDLKRLPPRYRDSVRAITPGLPLFLCNYTTHQLHGIFEAASFGGSNIDPTAWEDKMCKGESRFPAQVRIRIHKICKVLEEDSFRPVLHHYDGPKFRLELSVPETLDLLDLCKRAGSAA